MNGLLIGTTVEQTFRGLFYDRWVKRTAAVGIAGYTTHSMLFSVSAGTNPGTLGKSDRILEAQYLLSGCHNYYKHTRDGYYLPEKDDLMGVTFGLVIPGRRLYFAF
jgi:hypothetical protein